MELCVEESEMVALLGASGSGKTMLLRAIAGIEPLSAGWIEVNDKRLTKPRESTRLVLGGFGFFPWKTVYENLEFTLRVKGYDDPFKKMRLDDIVQALEIEEILDRYPDALDERQRLYAALACAFAPALDHLLLDDPTVRLPASAKWEMRALIRRLQREYPCTCVVATQDVEEAAFLGHRVILMAGGRIARIMENPFSLNPGPVEGEEFQRFCASLREALHEIL